MAKEKIVGKSMTIASAIMIVVLLVGLVVLISNYNSMNNTVSGQLVEVPNLTQQLNSTQRVQEITTVSYVLWREESTY